MKSRNSGETRSMGKLTTSIFYNFFYFYATQAVLFCLQFCFVVISTGDTEDNLEIEYILFFFFQKTIPYLNNTMCI